MSSREVLRCWFCGVLLCALAWGAPLRASAQAAAPVLARALYSVSPADTTFAELEFLRSEIGGARVVFLGEPTHGEGNVLAAKARLVAFLQQRMGFTTLALESGFFELHKAQREISIGKSVAKNLQSSIFPIWMQAREFQAVVPLVGQDGLRVMGFDPQLSGDYSSDLTDDLQDFLDDEKGSDALNYDRLDSLVSYMAARYAWPSGHQLAELQGELAKAEPLLLRAAAAPTAARSAEAVFWQQCLRSLGALARAYATQPAARIAADANLRDAQMADNLLWYLRQHPAEKVICWGALPHFANRVEELNNAELRAYRPMGRAMKEALGASQVYTLGTLAGGGTRGAADTPGVAVPTPAPGTLEANLLALNTPYAFVSLKHDAPGRQLVTYAIDYQPLAGPWSEVVDGFLFLQSVAPPHLTAADSAAASADTTAASLAVRQQPPGSLSPAPGQGHATIGPVVGVPDVSGVRLVRGVVLDQRSRAAVPYATVQLPGQPRATLADAQGRFALPLPGPTLLQVSGLGYNVSTVQSPRGNEELTVLLAPALYASAELRRVRPLPDPATVLANVIKNLPTNYDPQAYTAEVYAHRRFSSFDTLRYEAETVGRLQLPAGRDRAKLGTVGHDDKTLLLPEQQHVLVQQGKPVPPSTAAGWGLAASTADPLQTSPLFVARNLRNYTLRLDSLRSQGTDTLYVLSFVALRPDQHSAGFDDLSAYQGRLLVRPRDYAVVHYEALAQVDTARANAAVRRASARATPAQRAASQLIMAARFTHVANYAKASTGRYYLSRSVGQQVRAGRTPGRGGFQEQDFQEQYCQLLPTAGPVPVAPSKAVASPVTVPYRPEFWEKYQRPGGALVSPIARP